MVDWWPDCGLRVTHPDPKVPQESIDRQQWIDGADELEVNPH